MASATARERLYRRRNVSLHQALLERRQKELEMVAIVVVGGVCLAVTSSWLTVAHWVRKHAGEHAEKRPTLVLIHGGSDLRR
jgi:hypothetical protein